jgi:glycosyltransferase involved in cell wall biosynthesis
LKRLGIRRAKRVIFVSRGLQALYAREGLDLIDRSVVVHNIGPPAAANDGERDSGVVLFVGKLSTGKGLHVLYEAAAEVIRQLPSVKFELIGQPGAGWAPPPPSLREHVQFLGRLDEQGVRQRMARATLLVSPSLWPEPLSRVLLEAMSCGLPIVATRVGGTTEAVDDNSAMLVEPGDAPGLAAAMTRLLLEPGAAERLRREAGTRFQERFTPEHIVPQVLDVYRSAESR